MVVSPSHINKIDASLGNPLFPLTGVANYAFRQARKDLHRYQFLNAGRSETSVRNALSAMSDFFTARGIYPPGWSGLPFTNMMPVGGGTTEAFNLILQMLADDVRKENKNFIRHGQDPVKPAILMPVPTYGFFQDAARDLGFTIIPVLRDLKAGGVLRRDAVIAAIRAAHKDNLRIVSFFDSNPNNPTGLVRGEKETRELGRIILALSKHYGEQEYKEDGDASQQMSLWQEDLLFSLGRRKLKWSGPAARVRIIDDMVYDGLEYGTEKPFSFAQIPELFKDTFVLFGTSKAGLANLRGGLIIGDSEDMYALNHRSLMNEYFPSKVALHAMEAFFNVEEPFASQRRRHLDRLNKEHRFRGLLLKALVNGVDTMPEVQPADMRRMTNALMRHFAFSRQQATGRLHRNIPALKIISTPQAGFFHLVDFSALIGREYDNIHVPYKRYGGKSVVEDGAALSHVFTTGQQLHMAGGGWMGLGDKSMIGRMSFAMPVADIIESAYRLATGCRQFQCPACVPAPETLSR
jgi:aspartate/methionine/tyrosine aminotransferase